MEKKTVVILYVLATIVYMLFGWWYVTSFPIDNDVHNQENPSVVIFFISLYLLFFTLIGLISFYCEKIFAPNNQKRAFIIRASFMHLIAIAGLTWVVLFHNLGVSKYEGGGFLFMMITIIGEIYTLIFDDKIFQYYHG